MAATALVVLALASPSISPSHGDQTPIAAVHTGPSAEPANFDDARFDAPAPLPVDRTWLGELLIALQREQGITALAQPGLRGKTIWLSRRKTTLRELFDCLAVLCAARWYRVGDRYVLARSEALAQAAAVPPEEASRAMSAILWDLSDQLLPGQWEQLEGRRMLPYASLTPDQQQSASRFMTALCWWSPWCDWAEVTERDLVLSVEPHPPHPALMFDAHVHGIGSRSGLGIPYTEPDLRPKKPPPSLPQPMFEPASADRTWHVPGMPPSKRRSPVYYADSRFARLLATREGSIDPDDITDAVARLKTLGLAVPGYAMTPYIPLPAGKRRLRDALDAWAELMQGEWRKVDASYVLVLERPLLDGVEVSDDVRERRARSILHRLIGSFDHRELMEMVKGKAFPLPTTSPERREATAELGLLGYYCMAARTDPKAIPGEEPEVDRRSFADPRRRVHPRAIRGEGMTLAIVRGSDGPAMQVSLPTRAGTMLSWLSEPLER